MKAKQFIRCIARVLTLFAAVAVFDVQAQETLTTTSVETTTTAGTVSTLEGEKISVTTEKSASPASYRLSEKTTFVDESGNVVSREMVKRGLPVTVYYSGAGDAMTVSRVVVKKPRPAAVVEEERTTTTTTTTTEEE